MQMQCSAPLPLSTLKDGSELTVPLQSPNFSRSLYIIILPQLEIPHSIYKCIRL